MSFHVRPLKDTRPSKAQKKSLAAATLRWVAAASGPLIQVGHIWHEKQEQKKRNEWRINLFKRILVILVAVFCSFLVVAGTAKALVSLKILSIQSFAHIAGSNLPTDADGHTNILLLGQGDADHEGVDLTDTVMIASLDPEKTKSAVLMSLPRDLYFLETEKMGKGRLNSLYRDYKIFLKREGKTEQEASQIAMRELADEIGRAMNVEIHHIVKVDFIGFVQAVDAIEGVDIEVPYDLVDPEYPGPNYTYETFSINAGLQHLDGETALKYARSRHSTSDFSRSARQQQILRAIGDKVKNEGVLTKPRQILQLLNIMSEHMETTLKTTDMVSLAAMAKTIDASHIITMQLNSENGLYGALSEPGGLLYNPPRDQFGGAAVLLPVSVPEEHVTWNRLRLLTRLLIHERSVFVENAPIRIWNTGALPGSARRLGGELIRFGFNVVATENAPERRERPDTAIVASGSGVTATEIHDLFGYPLERSTLTQSGAGIVTIELGEDFEYEPLPGDSPTAP